MSKIVLRNVRMQDASVPMPRPLTHDEVLEAQTPHKSIALGTVWEGYIKPKYDTLVEQAGALHGFMVGHVVGAEPNPVIPQLLGRVWRGLTDMRSDLIRLGEQHDQMAPGATEIISSGESNEVDTTEALGAVELMRQALGTEEINMAKVGDAVARMKRARDGIRKGASRSTGDRRQHPRMTGDFSKPANIGELNRRSREHWDVQTGAATHDSAGEVRDAMHVANATPAGYFKNSALNEVSKAFWAGRAYTPGTATQDGHSHPVAQPNSGPLTAAEINAKNRAYWDARK